MDIFSGEEEGMLTGVEMVEADNTSPRHLVLTRMHLGRGSWAMLCCDNEEEVIPRLFEILKGCIGWEISRIGDLDVERRIAPIPIGVPLVVERLEILAR